MAPSLVSSTRKICTVRMYELVSGAPLSRFGWSFVQHQCHGRVFSSRTLGLVDVRESLLTGRAPKVLYVLRGINLSDLSWLCFRIRESTVA